MSALVQVAPTQAPKEPAPGEFALRNPAYELYARERARMAEPLHAMRRVAAEWPDHLAVIKAGFATATRANAAKFDRKPKIQERIAWLGRQDEDRIREKRQEIESYYWAALRTDPGVFWEEGEEEIRDKKGCLVVDHDGKPKTIPFKRLRRFDELDPQHRQLIEGLTYTEKGRPNLRLVPKTVAAKEIREMLGLDAPAKSALDVNHSGTVTLEALVLASYAPPVAPEEPQTIEHSES